jgi:hypothetical protein
VLTLGSLSVVALADVIRLPGVGGATQRLLEPGETDAGRGWTIRAEPRSATWVRAYPPDGPDLGILHCESETELTHSLYGTLTIPAGTWVLRETRNGG